MASFRSKQASTKKVSAFFAGMFGISQREFEMISVQAETPSETPSGEVLRMPGVIAPSNQPEFWADAPWRLEPDQTEIPITIYIRDANIESPGYSPWRINTLRIEQQQKNKKWQKRKTFLPADLPYVDEQGQIERNFWVFSTGIPREILQDATDGEIVHLRVIFEGSVNPYENAAPVTRHLEVYLARHALPQGRGESASSPRQWFYGDTHYHSAYSNDIKEYGAPLPDTRAAGLAVGLDWLVVTDHSCDLVLTDPFGSGRTRWDCLHTDISSPKISDDHFRFIIGEEITLIGRGEKFVHMLAMGGMQDVIPGAFLPDDSDSLLVDLWINGLKSILRLGKGYPQDLIPSLFGKLHSFEEVLHMLPEGTLIFAAHPYDTAQVPPAKWDEKDLAHPRMTGHEFWNGRSRRSAKQTDNPFVRKGWTDPSSLQREDEARIAKLLQRVTEKWEPHLITGVEEWTGDKPLPSHRPVFIGGSDAHGDFNYHAGMAWDYTKTDMIDDNRIGSVRTAIFLPENQSTSVPEAEKILAALKKGSCVVTDGPLLEFHLQHNGHVAYMGETLQLSGDGAPELKITAHSTPEFGLVDQVEVVSYFKGQNPRRPSILLLRRGSQAVLPITGSQGYCRIQAQTVGAGGERFCCFTNPIWIRAADRQSRTLQVSFS